MPIVRILLILVMIATAYYLRRRSVPPEASPVAVSDIQPGPIRHSSLSADLVARIQKFETLVAEVYPQTHEKWLEGFQRDIHPEAEIAIWEAIATAYQKFTEKRSLSLAAKNEAFGLLLVRSSQDTSTTLAGLKLKMLTQAEAEELLGLYSAAPQPIQYEMR